MKATRKETCTRNLKCVPKRATYRSNLRTTYERNPRPTIPCSRHFAERRVSDEGETVLATGFRSPASQRTAETPDAPASL